MVKVGRQECYFMNDWEQRFQAQQDGGSAVNISTYGIIFTVGDEYQEGSPIIQKKNANVSGGSGTQINMASATNGIYKIVINDTDQSGLNIAQNDFVDYKCDVKFVIGGKYYTQWVNTFRIKNVVDKVNP